MCILGFRISRKIIQKDFDETKEVIENPAAAIAKTAAHYVVVFNSI
jgi:hypothetical protein